MAAVQELGIDNSQWSSNSTSDTTGTSGYPQAWLKAQEALQKVNQDKKNTSLVTTVSNQTSSNPAFNYGYSFWPQLYGYPQYQMQGYNNYYNMTMPNSNTYASYYGFPAMTASSQVSTPTAQSSQQQTTAPTLSQQSSNMAISQLATQPPPPPPSPPKGNNENVYQMHNSKQAPGAGGIRFSMPKRLAQKGNTLLKFNEKKNQLMKKEFENMQNYDSQFSPVKPEKEAIELLGFKLDESMHWPTSLKDYITRCYANCTSKLQKDRMAIILKGKLGQALKNGTMWQKDWASEAILSLCGDQHRQEPKESPSNEVEKTLNYRLSTTIPKSIQRPKMLMYQKSRSRSRSRSRSLSPYPRRVVQRRDHSSSSNNSSNSSTEQMVSRKRSVCSSVVSPMEIQPHQKFSNDSRSVNRKKKNKKKKVVPFVLSPEDEAVNKARLQQRAARFKPAGSRKSESLLFTIQNTPVVQVYGMDEDEAEIDWSSYAIIGTSEDIEKPFLRITSAVDPSTIRPQHVLERSLCMAKDHWKKNHDYHFACEQLKSIRQDLVVQCIRNRFTITAYETHARIALEKGDHTEFNQCQSQLKMLYEEINEGNKEEFLAYRILYNMHTKDTREIKNIISTLSRAEKENSVISHALALNLAWTLNNFHVFFKLYITAPKMAGFIIDWFLGSVRKAAIKAFVKSYRPTLPVAFVQKELGFSSEGDCRAFLDELKVIYSDDKSCIMCKESVTSVVA